MFIDPATDTVDPDAIDVSATVATYRWSGGVLAANGKIYGIPNTTGSVLIIDVHSNGDVVSSIAERAYFNKF
jgi:hypothetical protein